MAVELAQYSTEVEVGVSKGFGVLEFELEFEGLDKVCEGSAYFSGPAVVTSEIIIGGSFELDRVACYELGFAEVIETEFEFLFL